jgi:fatty-acyl-CoA synthase
MSSDPRSLAALIQHSTDPDPAFRFDGVSVSRAEFEQRVDAATSWLAAQGIGKGDVIAVWLVNRLEWMALLFAAARLGSVVAAVNTRYRSADVAHVLRISGAKLLILEAQFRSIDFPAILTGIDRAAVPDLQKLAIVGTGDMTAPWQCVRFDAFEKGLPRVPTQQADVDSPVLLYTTSGTTKEPKLVAHSQATLAGHAASVARALAVSPGQHSLLAMLPFAAPSE